VLGIKKYCYHARLASSGSARAQSAARARERERERVPARKRDLVHPVGFRIRPATPGINLRGLLSAAMKIEGVSPSRTPARPQQHFRAKTRRFADESRGGFTDTQPSSDLHFTLPGRRWRKETRGSRSLNYLPAHVHRHDDATTNARQKQELRTVQCDSKRTNARLVCRAKPSGNYACILRK
jgi:hypothetical protein